MAVNISGGAPAQDSEEYRAMLHRRRMERGSEMLLHAITLARHGWLGACALKRLAGPDLIWLYDGDSIRPPAQTKDGSWAKLDREQAARVAEKRIETDRLVETLRVSRDPCPRCGVRADVGCRHSR